MLLAGLTGGLATGKSFIGRTLAARGCLLIRADDLGHEVSAPGGAAYGPIVREFGRDILMEDGAIDRKKLASLVFDAPERLAVLNSLVHPAVFRREEELLRQFAAEDPDGIAVLEAAILIEAGNHERCDKVILAVCPEKEQIARAMHRDGMSREEALARIRRQMPLDEKRRYADFIVDTSGTKEETVRQVDRVYEQLRSAKL
jgi:dephospho-CoA kinase